MSFRSLSLRSLAAMLACAAATELLNRSSPATSPSKSGEPELSGLSFTPRLMEASERAMSRLQAGNLGIVTAESCTAGLLAALFSRAKGASECLHGGFIAYTKAQKISALGLPADQLRVTSAVTAEVAAGMAYGSLSQSKADIAIAVTGVLGPMPDEDGNPVGLVYLALRDRSGVQEVARKEFGSLQHEVLTDLTLAAAVELLESYLSRCEPGRDQRQRCPSGLN